MSLSENMKGIKQGQQMYLTGKTAEGKRVRIPMRVNSVTVADGVMNIDLTPDAVEALP